MPTTPLLPQDEPDACSINLILQLLPHSLTPTFTSTPAGRARRVLHRPGPRGGASAEGQDWLLLPGRRGQLRGGAAAEQPQRQGRQAQRVCGPGHAGQQPVLGGVRAAAPAGPAAERGAARVQVRVIGAGLWWCGEVVVCCLCQSPAEWGNAALSGAVWFGYSCSMDLLVLVLVLYMSTLQSRRCFAASSVHPCHQPTCTWLLPCSLPLAPLPHAGTSRTSRRRLASRRHCMVWRLRRQGAWWGLPLLLLCCCSGCGACEHPCSLCCTALPVPMDHLGVTAVD